MSITILAIGLMVFFAHFLSLQFRKTSIPDVLVLMLLGILLGPLLGIVTPQDFGKVGSLIATIALVVILRGWHFAQSRCAGQVAENNRRADTVVFLADYPYRHRVRFLSA